MDRAKVIKIFEDEFGPIQHKFEIYDMPLAEAEVSQAPHIWKPGVYVFWQPDRSVIKVGRHLTNSRKRAFEHIPANTGGEMAKLKNDREARLLLFNVKEPRDKHWVAALEVFFEEQLLPKIKAGRLG